MIQHIQTDQKYDAFTHKIKSLQFLFWENFDGYQGGAAVVSHPSQTCWENFDFWKKTSLIPIDFAEIFHVLRKKFF